MTTGHLASAAEPATPTLRASGRWPVAVDLLVAATLLLLIGAMTLLTPVFTDFEAEAEPALQAFARGDLAEAISRLPLYGGALMVMAVPARIAALLGGGDVALFRAVALPGALGMAGFAALASAWLRGAGRARRDQLAAVVLIAGSPALAHAWQLGHPEELLVAAIGLAGVVAAASAPRRAAVAAGLLVGFAAGAKLWAVVLVPVAIIAAPTASARLRIVLLAPLAGAAALLPTYLAMREQLATWARATGGSDIFTVGNLWWFTGTPNPSWEAAQRSGVVQLNSIENSPRLGPDWVGAYAHEGIVAFGLSLAAVWWWRQRHAPAGHARTASVLALAAAILWWRGLADPWMQPYYLTPAILAMVLMDARAGRWPIAAAVAWSALWLLSVQNAPAMSLHPDVRSALLLSWSIPLGIWLVIRALRPVR